MENKFRRVAFVFIGSFLMGVGIALSITTGFGSDPLGMFWQGISNVTNFTIGQSNIIISVIMALIPIIYNKSELGLGTIAAPFTIGLVIDFILSLNLSYTLLYTRLLVMIFGLVTLALGAAIYINADMGKSTYDATICIISQKVGLSIGRVRSLGDLALFSSSLFLKVSVNLAPFVAIIIIGPLIDKFLVKIDSTLVKGD